MDVRRTSRAPLANSAQPDGDGDGGGGAAPSDGGPLRERLTELADGLQEVISGALPETAENLLTFLDRLGSAATGGSSGEVLMTRARRR